MPTAASLDVSFVSGSVLVARPSVDSVGERSGRGPCEMSEKYKFCEKTASSTHQSAPLPPSYHSTLPSLPGRLPRLSSLSTSGSRLKARTPACFVCATGFSELAHAVSVNDDITVFDGADGLPLLSRVKLRRGDFLRMQGQRWLQRVAELVVGLA